MCVTNDPTVGPAHHRRSGSLSRPPSRQHCHTLSLTHSERNTASASPHTPRRMSLARSGRVAPLLALAILCVGLLVPLLAADGATVGSTLAVQYYNDSSCTVQNSLSLSYASTDNGGCGLYQGSSSPTAYVKYTCSNVTATNISVTVRSTDRTCAAQTRQAERDRKAQRRLRVLCIFPPL